jgi:hypothetical protein
MNELQFAAEISVLIHLGETLAQARKVIITKAINRCHHKNLEQKKNKKELYVKTLSLKKVGEVDFHPSRNPSTFIGRFVPPIHNGDFCLPTLRNRPLIR